ncbi:MAG: tRNA (guanine(46)-N(7))-methyltransferase TrmB, partial [Rickettsiales bacterium]|nr:tRNA (guanine(46)-N(7))-methyltransferase TrmB [Rickettsiales bacterium]
MEKAKIPLIRTFGRTKQRTLSARQQWLIDNLLPHLIPIRGELSRSDLGGAILEIGFGTGEHVIELAEQNPDKIIIGAEPFINGVASLLSKIVDENNEIKPEFKNIRIFPDDVRKLLSDMNTAFDEIYILHPDPWPKARHEKRRLINREFLKTLSFLISKNGKIIIGTDHTDYYNWILEQIQRTNLKTYNREISAIKTKYQ